MSSYGYGAEGGDDPPPQSADQPGNPGDGRSEGSGSRHKGHRPKGTTDWGGAWHQKGYGKHGSGGPKGKKSSSAKPDRVAQLIDTVEKLAETVGNLAIASAQNTATASASSSSKQKKGSEPNPNGTSYSNAKRSLQKKRSALLKMFNVTAGSDFCWEKEFPDTEETRARIDKIRTEQPDAYKRLITGIRSAEQKVKARKVDPANGGAQPLQVLPSYFGGAENDGEAEAEEAAEPE